MSDPRDMTGIWYGGYDGVNHAQRAGFIANLEEAAGHLFGTITDQDGIVRRALISGQRSGSAVRFVKQYDGSGGWAHQVHYVGEINDEGTEVHGAWQVEWLHGSFVMRREKFADEELLVEDEIVEPVAPVDVPR